MADAGRLRLDTWLWRARFCRTRGLAVALVQGGHLRLNGAKTLKAGHALGPGDVLTLAQGGAVRVVRVLSCGTRRGPAAEARALYDDLAPAPPGPAVPPGGGGAD